MCLKLRDHERRQCIIIGYIFLRWDIRNNEWFLSAYYAEIDRIICVIDFSISDFCFTIYDRDDTFTLQDERMIWYLISVQGIQIEFHFTRILIFESFALKIFMNNRAIVSFFRQDSLQLILFYLTIIRIRWINRSNELGHLIINNMGILSFAAALWIIEGLYSTNYIKCGHFILSEYLVTPSDVGFDPIVVCSFQIFIVLIQIKSCQCSIIRSFWKIWTGGFIIFFVDKIFLNWTLIELRWYHWDLEWRRFPIHDVMIFLRHAIVVEGNFSTSHFKRLELRLDVLGLITSALGSLVKASSDHVVVLCCLLL